MSGQGNRGAKGGAKRRFSRASLIAAGVAALGIFVVPTVGNALAGRFEAQPVSLAARGGVGSFTPASVDPRLAAQLSLSPHGKLFRFTPAGSETRPDRAVTVAIRIDGDEARAISVRGALPATATAPGFAAVRIAPTVYNLGAARGYQSFAAGTATLPREIERLNVPDLRSFTPAGSTTPVNPGRLAPRIQIDEKERAGRAPRTLENQGDYQLDFGGSYRLTRNFNVTAGIRYSSERDRLRPLTDGKQDNQAVYVGTQFRF